MSDERIAAHLRPVRRSAGGRGGAIVGGPFVPSRHGVGSNASRCYCRSCGAKKTAGRCPRGHEEPARA